MGFSGQEGAGDATCEFASYGMTSHFDDDRNQ